MKRVKVWWDYDDERYSTEAFLFEEGVDTLRTKAANTDVTQKFNEFLAEHGMVGFVNPEHSYSFGIKAERIVKLEVLEE